MENSSKIQRVRCTACQADVVGNEERRAHYRSDLHLVNLKRKVSGLGPLTELEFTSRLAVLQKNKTEQELQKGDRRRGPNRERLVCTVCSKTFSSAQAFQNHEKSRRHLDALRGKHGSVSEVSEDVNGDKGDGWVEMSPGDMEQDTELPLPINARAAEAESLHARTAQVQAEAQAHAQGQGQMDWSMDDESVEVDNELKKRMEAWRDEGSDSRSAFDGAQLASAGEALDYMHRNNGLIIPYGDRLVDKSGLVRYLLQKVTVGYACIACDRGFASVDDTRKHMRDVGHCRLSSDDDGFFDEFEEYYDWGVPDASAAAAVDGGDAGWEEVADGDVTLTEAEHGGQVVVVQQDDAASSTSRERPVGRLDDGAGDDDAVGQEAFSLVLGDKVIGHRSLLRYYKQSGGTVPDSREAVLVNRNRNENSLTQMRKAREMVLQHKRSGRSKAQFRHLRFQLMVGQQNYYVRKSKVKLKLVVLNSGYRC